MSFIHGKGFNPKRKIYALYITKKINKKTKKYNKKFQQRHPTFFISKTPILYIFRLKYIQNKIYYYK